jgi:hypothetical protein
MVAKGGLPKRAKASKPPKQPGTTAIQRKMRTIVDGLLAGRITINAAEKRADRLGTSLLNDPQRKFEDQSDHPDNRLYWTLPMVVAWGMWRSMEKVIEQTDQWRSQATRYVDFPSGHPLNVARLNKVRSKRVRIEILPYGPATVRELRANSADWEDWDRAWLELRTALMSGRIEATGIDERTDRWVVIPTFEWQDEAVVYHVEGGHPLPTHYRDVTLKRDDVLRMWGPHRAPTDSTLEASPNDESQTVHPSRRFSKRKAEEEYLRRVEEWPRNSKPPSQREDETYMQQKIPEITRDEVRDLRSKHAPLEWNVQRRGRKHGKVSLK